MKARLVILSLINVLVLFLSGRVLGDECEGYAYGPGSLYCDFPCYEGCTQDWFCPTGNCEEAEYWVCLCDTMGPFPACCRLGLSQFGEPTACGWCNAPGCNDIGVCRLFQEVEEPHKYRALCLGV